MRRGGLCRRRWLLEPWRTDSWPCSRPLAVLVLAVTAGNAAWLAVVAMAGVWITKRAPGLNVSFTDLLVAAAGVTAWAAGVGRTLRPGGRILLRSFAFYLGALGVTLAYNQSLRSDFEWFHRVGMVAGAVFVGAWLVRAGLHHSALRALLAVTVLISVFAVVDSVSSGFAPAQPFGYQKNFIGSITATVLLVVLAAYKEFRLPVRWLRARRGPDGSRDSSRRNLEGRWWPSPSARSFGGSGARRRSTPRLRTLALLSAVVLAVVVAVSVKNQLQAHGSSYEFDSALPGRADHATAVDRRIRSPASASGSSRRPPTPGTNHRTTSSTRSLRRQAFSGS